MIGNRAGGAAGTALAVLAILAVAPYVRALGLPLISDDYLQIWLGRHYGPMAAWPDLAGDVLYRCRATSILITHWTESLLGVSPLVLNATSVVLHILNTWLVFALGFWRSIGWRVSFVAAAFFAVYEGHQEAVIWYAALPELLVFFFSLLAFLLWLQWIRDGRRRWAAGAFAAYLLALLSKEPGAAVVPLLLLPLWTERVPVRRWLAPWLGFAAVAVVYAGMIIAGSSSHLFFHDGSFSFSAPVGLVLTNSMGRMMWFWGAAALAAVAAWRAWRWRPLLAVALAWAVVTFLPYSFLTYMPRVPSRHTYFASVALGWLVAAGLLTVYAQRRKAVFWVLAAVMVLHNAGYVWTRKHQQYVERAMPTEELIAFVRQTEGEVYVHCFPYAPILAEVTAEVALGRKVLTTPPERPGAAVFCYEPNHVAMAMFSGE